MKIRPNDYISTDDFIIVKAYDKWSKLGTRVWPRPIVSEGGLDLKQNKRFLKPLFDRDYELKICSLTNDKNQHFKKLKFKDVNRIYFDLKKYYTFVNKHFDLTGIYASLIIKELDYNKIFLDNLD